MKNLLYVISVVGFIAFNSPTFANTGAHGVFRVVKGNVTVKSAQGGQVTKARLGSKVLPGDIIITEADSRAKVVMVDNNEINVSPSSQIEIQKYEFDPSKNKKDVLLNVIYGKVRSKVEQKYDGKTSQFQVKTPSAVAGVRGTDFLAGYTAATGVSQVVTFEGRVEFGMPGPGGQILNPVFVVPGQMAEIGKGGMPANPVEMKKIDLDSANSDSNAETGGSTSSRDPSSARGPSMVDPKDMPAASEPQIITPPPPPAPPKIDTSDIQRRVIEGGNAIVNIKVRNQ